MARTWWVVGVAVALPIAALGCERSDAIEPEASRVDTPEQYEGAGAADTTDRVAAQEPQAPIGAAPEDREAPVPGQTAEPPGSPGAVPRDGEGRDALGARAEQATPDTDARTGTAPGAPAAEPETDGAERETTAGTAATAAPGGATQAREAGEAAGGAPAEGVSEPARRMAVADLEATAESGGEGVTGTVVLTEDERGVMLEANVAGLEPGTHRIAIREDTSCEAEASRAAEATRAGEARAAGASEETTTRSGAEERGEMAAARAERPIGEVDVGRDGAVQYRLLTDQLSLDAEDEGSVIGKTFVIESDDAPAAQRDEEAPEVCGVIESAG